MYRYEEISYIIWNTDLALWKNDKWINTYLKNCELVKWNSIKQILSPD